MSDLQQSHTPLQPQLGYEIQKELFLTITIRVVYYALLVWCSHYFAIQLIVHNADQCDVSNCGTMCFIEN